MTARDVKMLCVGAIAGLVLAGAGCAWLSYRPSLPSVLAPQAKELAKEETTVIEGQKVAVFKPATKTKLGLPATVQKDPDKHVVAASPIPPSEHPHTMTAVYDSGTGAVDMFLRRDPLPWFAATTRYELGVGYGYGNDGAAARLDGSADLLQIKALHFGAVGTADSAGNWFAGGRIWARF